MKGKRKKRIGILLTTVLMLSMAAPGFAGETGTTPKVTIHSRTVGHTFEMYQIFGGDVDSNEAGESILTNIGWGVGVDVDKLITRLSELASDPESALYEGLKDIDTSAWDAETDEEKKALASLVAKALSGADAADQSVEAYAFADAVSACLSDPSATAGTTNENDKDSDEYADGYYYYYELTGFEEGYYILMDRDGTLDYTGADETLDTASYTRYILGVISDGVTVHAKADTPTIDKYFVDPDKENPEKTGEYNIGDDIICQLNSTVPDMEGYTGYWFMAEDTLCEGLDFIGMKSVTAGDADVSPAKTVYRTFDETAGDYSTPLTEEYYNGSGEPVSSEDPIMVGAGTYTLYWYEFYDTNGTDSTSDDIKTKTKLYIVLNGFYDSYQDKTGAEILITYIVRLNENASIGATGNDNMVDLIYSNNPNDTYGGEPSPDTEKNPGGGIGRTTTKKTVSYTTLIRLIKVDAGDTDHALAGATFTLTGASGTTYYILEKREDYEYVEDENGEYVNSDGFITGSTAGEWITYDETQHQGYTRYTKVSVDSTYTVTTRPVNDAANLIEVSGTTGNDGYVTFEGLGAGIYKITETSAPAGYNRLTGDIYVRITYTDPDGFADAAKPWPDQPDTGDPADWSCEYCISDSEPDSDTEWTECNMGDGIEVQDTSGILLPSTGGAGTVIFMAAGLCMMAGAVVVLDTKRRRKGEV